MNDVMKGVGIVLWSIAMFLWGFHFGTWAVSDDCNDHGHFKYNGEKYECKAPEAK
jgi:hypothetical protein